MKVLTPPVGLANIPQEWIDFGKRSTVKVDPVPKEFLTTKQWGRVWGLSTQHASAKIRHFIYNGEMETEFYKIRTGQLVRAVPHYAIIQKRKR